MRRKLVKGNEAVAMGALDAGCKHYFGYPITPQNEIPEYLSRELPKIGGVFVQAESEIASINMLLGAGSSGVRAMTSSSSPGISLKQEGISYMAGSEVPGVIVNMSRSSPGLGGISASQGDYWQAVKGGGHGDYHVIVLAPDSVQELYTLTARAFDYADIYRNPVMVLGDAVLGQMKEPLLRELPPPSAIYSEPHLFQFNGSRVVVMHHPDWLDAFARPELADIVAYGHLHNLHIEHRPPWIINPGEVFGLKDEPTVVFFDTSLDKPEVIRLNELPDTGQTPQYTPWNSA